MLNSSVSKALRRVINTRATHPLFLSSVSCIATLLVFLVCIIFGSGIKDLMISAYLGHDTVYAKGFSESKFRSVKVGMKTEDLLSVLGPPLKRAPWGSLPEVWQYTDQRSITDNFWRRWVVIDLNTDSVTAIFDDFWED
jgi:outer membrane protein assembly factor BamE (lipoprotein component of BamABCDE complex)